MLYKKLEKKVKTMEDTLLSKIRLLKDALLDPRVSKEDKDCIQRRLDALKEANRKDCNGK